MSQKQQVYCRYCGNLIDEDSAFCAYCGKKNQFDTKQDDTLNIRGRAVQYMEVILSLLLSIIMSVIYIVCLPFGINHKLYSKKQREHSV